MRITFARACRLAAPLAAALLRPQNTNVIYAISDEPMSAEEWKKQTSRIDEHRRWRRRLPRQSARSRR